MNEIIKERFPFLLPIGGPPTLWTVNGIGFRVYGRRDFDDVTKTYVTTHFFVFLFIPILAFAAYRVADAENGGWYFLGKEPVSTFAYRYNLFVGLIIAVSALIMWARS